MSEFHIAAPDFGELAGDFLAAGNGIRFRANGRSMSPFIRDGDIVLAEKAERSCLRAGDVVLCRTPGGRVTVHRIVRRAARDGWALWVTRGDALFRDDPPTPPDELLGRVWALERRGRVVRIDRGVHRAGAVLWRWTTPVRRLALGVARRLRLILGPPRRS